LKHARKAIVSKCSRAGCAAGRAHERRLLLVDLRLVVRRDHPRRAQDRLAQPADAEEQEENPDDELKRRDRDAAERGAEDGDEDDEEDRAGGGAEEGGAPAARGADGEHDRKRLDALDE
jgi:hypothetical protein